MNDQALVSLSKAQIALASCKTAMEAKQISDAAEAARVYLERTNASAATVNQATEIRILAERQMGAFLKEMPKAEGTRLDGGDVDGVPVVTQVDRRETLAEIGITKNESARSQKLAEIPAAEFELRIDEAKKSGAKLSTSLILKKPKAHALPRTPLTEIAKEAFDEQMAAKSKNPKLTPDGFTLAILTVLSRHFPNHVGALSDKVATPDDVYAAYPRQEAGRTAIKAICGAMKRQNMSAAALLQITIVYAGAVAKWGASRHDREGRDTCPLGATFFNQDRFLDDPKVWERLPKAETSSRPKPRVMR